jgi:hypothetical protein
MYEVLPKFFLTKFLLCSTVTADGFSRSGRALISSRFLRPGVLPRFCAFGAKSELRNEKGEAELDFVTGFGAQPLEKARPAPNPPQP